MRLFLTPQLNVTDNDYSDLFISECFNNYPSFASFEEKVTHNLCITLRKPGGNYYQPKYKALTTTIELRLHYPQNN